MSDETRTSQIQRAVRALRNSEAEALLCAIAYSQNPCVKTLVNAECAIDDAIAASAALDELIHSQSSRTEPDTKLSLVITVVLLFSCYSAQDVCALRSHGSAPGPAQSVFGARCQIPENNQACVADEC